MASPFQRYTGGIEASTGNLVPAYGQMAEQTIRTLSGFGESIAEGIKTYNENTAKGEILTQEAEALADQIKQFASQFGDSPEHAPFAQSLQPYIEKLSKVPSMSLSQKMGTVTGVKAGFANIGQQLQVFELMRKERLNRDINTARLGVKEFDEQTVPTAIIPSGKMPYFYNKSYAENEAELVRLTNEAKAKGANVDLPTVLSNWRNGLKANAMSRTDLPPEVKERLVSQLDTAEKFDKNSLSQEDAAEFMMEGSQQSVKDQLAPPKVKAPANKGTAPASGATGTAKESKPVSTEEAQAAGKKAIALENDIRALFGTRTKLEPYEQKRKDKMLAEIKALRETAAKGELGKLPMPQSNVQKPVDPRVAEAESVKRKAKDELTKIDALIKQADKAIENETDTPRGWTDKVADAMESGVIDSINVKGFEEMARLYISQGRIKEVTPDNARMILNELNSDSMGNLALLGAIITPDPSAFGFGLVDSIRELTREEKRNIEGAFTEFRSQDRIKRAEKSGDATFLKQELLKRKELLQNQLTTGRSAPKPADIAKIKQVIGGKEKKPEPEYALTNQQNLSLGTTTMKVATSIDNKRKDMMTFFQNKYGYVPASFEETFKSIYPEANFKTMETAYGAFMYDGKEWKQIQVQQPKTMSNKEIAEEKAVTFGVSRADGSLDFQELAPRSGIYVRGIYAGSPADAGRFRTEMLETANARVAVNRLIEINDMVGESMPWNAKLWGEAKALLPQIKAGLRTDIIGVGTVSNYEQQLIEEVVADPTKFWSLESSDRAKLAEIMRRVTNRLADKPAMFGLEVKIAGQTNAETERSLRLGRAGKSKLELDFEARGGKKGVKLDWDLTNKIPDALKN